MKMYLLTLVIFLTGCAMTPEQRQSWSQAIQQSADNLQEQQRYEDDKVQQEMEWRARMSESNRSTSTNCTSNGVGGFNCNTY